MNKLRSIIFVIILIIVLSGVFFKSIVNLITDYFWFSSEGYGIIFTTILKNQILLGAITGLLAFLIIYINLRIAIYVSSNFTTNVSFGSFLQIDINKYFKKFAFMISLAIGFLSGIYGALNWEIFLKFFNSTDFGIADPVFNRDISYYFFRLPLIKIILNFVEFILIISAIIVVLNYLAKGLIFIKTRLFQVEKRAKIHLLVILALFFIILALQIYFVRQPNLLYSTTGPFTGASYTDINARLPFLKILFFVAIFTSLLIIFNIIKLKTKLIISAIMLFLVVSIISAIYPAIIQKFIVLPNELIKETPYIERNIKATREAFTLDQVEVLNLPGDTNLTFDDIEKNKLTVKNVRLWDRQPLLDTFGQIQEIRTYYDFISIDNDRYIIDDEYRQTMLSPRELNSQSLPSRTFINEKLSFTHGYGLALGPVNEVSEEGLPLLFVKDLPPKSSKSSIEVKRPELYFSELSSDYVFVNTKAKEFNYPKGDENVFSEYEGKGGVGIESLLKKALFAIRFGSMKILLSNDIDENSKIMYYRDINERVRKILPFLKFDSDPYLIIDDQGRLKWIYDAYTFGQAYPYSEFISILGHNDTFEDDPFFSDQINYIRNAVKIVIDAYDGEMKFYLMETDDPIINTYAKIFKDIFLPAEQMPEDIKRHIRYPEDIFKYQTDLYSVYHMAEPQIFYNKEDKWEIPTISGAERGDPMMRHMIMKLPQEELEEFILMLPYTPRNKDNLAAWMVARSDGEHYGEMVVYRFPKQKLIFGPQQIVNRINQDAEISKQISLWDQRGSQVDQGNLLVIPIEESLIYIRPLYIRAEGGKIPELKRVIVAYENKIVMETNLDLALAKIFTGKTELIESEEIEEVSEETIEKSLVEQAQEHYDGAQAALKAGDWSLYGEEIKKLGEVLDQMK